MARRRSPLRGRASISRGAKLGRVVMAIGWGRVSVRGLGRQACFEQASSGGVGEVMCPWGCRWAATLAC